MAAIFTDSADRPIGTAPTYLTFDVVAGETTASFPVKVTPDADRTFRSSSHALITLKARETGSGDPYTDLTTGIDLSGYPAGVPVSFDLICECSALLTGLVRATLALVVASTSAANWNL